MKRKKGKYRIGRQRDWANARIKGRYNLNNLCIGIIGGIDRGPLPQWTVTERMVNIMSDERMVRGMPLKERSI